MYFVHNYCIFSEISPEFNHKMTHLIVYSGHGHSTTEEVYNTTVTRLVWLQYCVALLRMDLGLALTAIDKVTNLYIYFIKM